MLVVGQHGVQAAGSRQVMAIFTAQEIERSGVAHRQQSGGLEGQWLARSDPCELLLNHENGRCFVTALEQAPDLGLECPCRMESFFSVFAILPYAAAAATMVSCLLSSARASAQSERCSVGSKDGRAASEGYAMEPSAPRKTTAIGKVSVDILLENHRRRVPG